MGLKPPHGVDPGGASPLGGDTAHGENPPTTYRWDMELTSISGGHVVSGDQEDRDIYWEAIEHGGELHQTHDYHGTLPGGRGTPGGKGSEALVGAVGTLVSW